ncbi:hypothetical protein ADEAN_000757300 [Angomonas deanei]|uniref:Uncharacterized protein n=1 Tax=Angomonas deanei TaxID=59799 RepID=A0A7G2CKW1_9TRYP|nr:hypothetical protein ADEAN_000757300 [Angomonas deanei]
MANLLWEAAHHVRYTTSLRPVEGGTSHQTDDEWEIQDGNYRRSIPFSFFLYADAHPDYQGNDANAFVHSTIIQEGVRGSNIHNHTRKEELINSNDNNNNNNNNVFEEVLITNRDPYASEGKMILFDDENISVAGVDQEGRRLDSEGENRHHNDGSNSKSPDSRSRLIGHLYRKYRKYYRSFAGAIPGILSSDSNEPSDDEDEETDDTGDNAQQNNTDENEKDPRKNGYYDYLKRKEDGGKKHDGEPSYHGSHHPKHGDGSDDHSSDHRERNHHRRPHHSHHHHHHNNDNDSKGDDVPRPTYPTLRILLRQLIYSYKHFEDVIQQHKNGTNDHNNNTNSTTTRSVNCTHPANHKNDTRENIISRRYRAGYVDYFSDDSDYSVRTADVIRTGRNPLGWVPCMHFLAVLPIEEALHRVQLDNVKISKSHAYEKGKNQTSAEGSTKPQAENTTDPYPPEEDENGDTLLALFYAPDLFPQYNYIQWLESFALSAYGLYRERQLFAEEEGIAPSPETTANDEEKARKCEAYFHYISPLGKAGNAHRERRRAMIQQKVTIAVVDAYYPPLNNISAFHEFLSAFEEDTYHVKNYEALTREAMDLMPFSRRDKKNRTTNPVVVNDTLVKDGTAFEKVRDVVRDRTIDTEEYRQKRANLIRLIGIEGATVRDVVRALQDFNKQSVRAAAHHANDTALEEYLEGENTPVNQKTWNHLPSHRGRRLSDDLLDYTARNLFSTTYALEPEDFIAQLEQIYSRLRRKQSRLVRRLFSSSQLGKYRLHPNVTAQRREGFSSEFLSDVLFQTAPAEEGNPLPTAPPTSEESPSEPNRTHPAQTNASHYIKALNTPESQEDEDTPFQRLSFYHKTLRRLKGHNAGGEGEGVEAPLKQAERRTPDSGHGEGEDTSFPSDNTTDGLEYETSRLEKLLEHVPPTFHGVQVVQGGQPSHAPRTAEGGRVLSCYPLDPILYDAAVLRKGHPANSNKQSEDHPSEDEFKIHTPHFCGSAAARNYLLRQNPPCLFFPYLQGSRPHFCSQAFLKIIIPIEEVDEDELFAGEEESIYFPPSPSEDGERPTNHTTRNRATDRHSRLYVTRYRNPFTLAATHLFNYNEVLEAPSSPYPNIVLLSEEAKRASPPDVLRLRRQRADHYLATKDLWLAEQAARHREESNTTNGDSLSFFEVGEYFFEHDGSLQIDPERFVESAPLLLHFFIRTPQSVIESELLRPLQQRVELLRREVQDIILAEVAAYADPNIFNKNTLANYESFIPKNNDGRDPLADSHYPNSYSHEDIALGDVQARVAWSILLHETRRQRNLFGLLTPIPATLRTTEVDDATRAAQITAIQQRNRNISLYLFHNHTAEQFIRHHPLNLQRYQMHRRLQEAVRLARQARIVKLTATEEDFQQHYIDNVLQEGMRRHRVLQELHFYQEVERLEKAKAARDGSSSSARRQGEAPDGNQSSDVPPFTTTGRAWSDAPFAKVHDGTGEEGTAAVTHQDDDDDDGEEDTAMKQSPSGGNRTRRDRFRRSHPPCSYRRRSGRLPPDALPPPTTTEVTQVATVQGTPQQPHPQLQPGGSHTEGTDPRGGRGGAVAAARGGAAGQRGQRSTQQEE